MIIYSTYEKSHASGLHICILWPSHEALSLYIHGFAYSHLKEEMNDWHWQKQNRRTFLNCGLCHNPGFNTCLKIVLLTINYESSNTALPFKCLVITLTLAVLRVIEYFKGPGSDGSHLKSFLQRRQRLGGLHFKASEIGTNSKSLSQKYLSPAEIKCGRVGPGPTLKYGESFGICHWFCALEWPTVQTPTESAFLHYPLANLHKSRSSDLTFIFTWHYSRRNLHVPTALSYLFFLPVPNTQRTNQLHCHSPNYLQLTYQQYYQRDFSQGVMVAQKRLSKYFTNLLTAVASCMCIAQGRISLPTGNINSYSSVGFQCQSNYVSFNHIIV
jgi:hypothetical protein